MWVLLDNQSTDDVFCNNKLLVDIHTIVKSIVIYTNGEEMVVTTGGRFPGYGWVWYDLDGIANIITLTNMKKRHCVTYNSGSSGRGNVIVHVPWELMQFQQSASYIYFHDMRNSNIMVFTQYNIATVQDNAEGFSPKQLPSARLAHRLQYMTANPSNANISTMVKCNMLKKMPCICP